MTTEQRTYPAGIADLIVVGPQLVEIHYRPGVVFTAEAAEEVQATRRKVMGDRPYATLTFIPEDVDFQLDAMRKDHGQADRTQSQLLASAVVARASMMEMLTKLYLSYFPQLHRVFVTDDEQEARAWLRTQLDEIARTA